MKETGRTGVLSRNSIAENRQMVEEGSDDRSIKPDRSAHISKYKVLWPLEQGFQHATPS